jgi:hypothetical protein
LLRRGRRRSAPRPATPRRPTHDTRWAHSPRRCSGCARRGCRARTAPSRAPGCTCAASPWRSCHSSRRRARPRAHPGLRSARQAAGVPQASWARLQASLQATCARTRDPPSPRAAFRRSCGACAATQSTRRAGCLAAASAAVAVCTRVHQNPSQGPKTRSAAQTCAAARAASAVRTLQQSSRRQRRRHEAAS